MVSAATSQVCPTIEAVETEDAVRRADLMDRILA